MDTSFKKPYQAPSALAVNLRTAGMLCASPQSSIDVTYGEIDLQDLL